MREKQKKTTRNEIRKKKKNFSFREGDQDE